MRKRWFTEVQIIGIRPRMPDRSGRTPHPMWRSIENQRSTWIRSGTPAIMWRADPSQPRPTRIREPSSADERVLMHHRVSDPS
jgi:hypothetical protein